ncbi:MAG: 4-alpha-glucanotransferase, partial [Gemmatimonas sp.]|uniref:efflux RND transporter periplasmic adaptor subunit n=1 Tax=Gemmatimonas sp. TaxID=1962908 RepID=UPI00391F170B
MTGRILFLAFAVVGAAACGGTKPADNDAATADEPAGGAITLWTDSTELFMEHPALIVGAPDKFAVHLTDLTDFAPLRSGRITLTFMPRGGGAPLVVVQDTPRAPGIYGPSPTFTAAGVYDLVIRVESPQARDSIVVPGLTVYANAAAAPRDSGGAESGISFLKEQAWKTPGFRSAFATAGELAGSFEAPGVIEAAAGRFAQVSAPIAGLVDASGVANAPAPGMRVSRGQTLALLAPSLGDAGSAAYAEARARLREAEDEHARAVRLYAVEAVPQRRVHEAEIRLAAAREALAGYGGGELSASGRVAVRSPVAGVIADRRVTPGSRGEAGTRLFTVVDPSVVWLRVNVPAAQAANVSRTAGVEFLVEGSERVYVARRVVSLGSVIDSLSRSVPLLLEVANPDGTLKVQAGVPPDYFSETGQLWGNPLYDWERMHADGYRWWIERMRAGLQLFDLVRLDHF